MSETRILSNGAVYDMDKKRIVSMQPGNTEHSRAMATTRWEKAKEAAAAGMIAGVNQVIPLDPRAVDVDAWGTIIAHNTAVIMRSDDTRGLAELTRQVGQAADMLPDKTHQQDTGITASVHIPADQLVPLLQALQAERERRMVDATAADADTPTTTYVDDDLPIGTPLRE